MPYPGSYDPYQVYQASSYRTNGLAIASLITSIAGVVLGIPLASSAISGCRFPSSAWCWASSRSARSDQTHQPGRGFAIAGIVIGWLTTVAMLFLLAMVVLNAAALKSPMLMRL